MHKKYTNQQIKNFEYDKNIEKFHNGELDLKRIEDLTKIRCFEKQIYYQHKINQQINMKQFQKDISMYAEILVDNWIMKIQAYKNQMHFQKNTNEQKDT